MQNSLYRTAPIRVAYTECEIQRQAMMRRRLLLDYAMSVTSVLLIGILALLIMALGA